MSFRRLAASQALLFFPEEIVEDGSRPPDGDVRLQEHFLIAIVGIIKHLLLLLEREVILGNDSREHFRDPLRGLFGRIALRHVLRRNVDQDPPIVPMRVDRRMGMNKDISSLIGIRVEASGVVALLAVVPQLSRGRIPHDHARDTRAHHAMRVMPVDGVVVEPVHEIRRLRVVADLANRHRVSIAVDLAFLELDRNAAVGDVSDIAVVKRIEMRDVQQVLDQKDVVGRHVHRTDDFSAPFVGADLGQARRPARFGGGDIAGPQPDDPVLLDDREWAHDGLRRDRSGRVRRDHHALAGHVVAQAVVRTFERAVVHQPAFGEREPLVSAPVIVGDHRALLRSPGDDRLPRDDVTGQFPGREIRRRADHVPAVANAGVGRQRAAVLDVHWGVLLVVRGCSAESQIRVTNPARAERRRRPARSRSSRTAAVPLRSEQCHGAPGSRRCSG